MFGDDHNCETLAVVPYEEGQDVRALNTVFEKGALEPEEFWLVKRVHIKYVQIITSITFHM